MSEFSDALSAWVVIAVFAGLALAYFLRVSLRGRPRFDRIERDGGSKVLSKGMMEMVYWGVQPVARLLVFFHITPNILSGASLAFGAASGASLAFGHFGSGGVFALIAAILDILDGHVARVTGVTSEAGEVLDASVDRYTEFFFLAGLAFYYREVPILLGFTLLAILGSFMVSYSTAKAEAMHVEPPRGSMRRPERAAYLIAGALLSPVVIPWLEPIRKYPVELGYPMVAAVALVAVLSNISSVERLWAVAKSLRTREKALRCKEKLEQELEGSPERNRV